jgi:hypothetical protein
LKKYWDEGLWTMGIFYGESSNNSEKERSKKETGNRSKKECGSKKRERSFKIQVQVVRVCLFAASRGAAQWYSCRHRF